MSTIIVGPVLSDLASIGGGDVTIATAFYTAGALNALNPSARDLRLFVRFDTRSLKDWAAGAIDPVALQKFICRHQTTCRSVTLLVSPTAHAKVYLGKRGFFVGSANLSRRAFSGSAAEMLWYESDSRKRLKMLTAIEEYQSMFSPMSLTDLASFVRRNSEAAKRLRTSLPKAFRGNQDRVPRNIVRPQRLGDYEQFLRWLDSQPEAASRTILDRANGQANLSGHIRQGFFGLRQFFLNTPGSVQTLYGENPDTYRRASDPDTGAALKDFLLHRVHDEGPFIAKTWRTYLPKAIGGKQTSGGASSGNVTKMLPLVARYVHGLLGSAGV